MLEGEVLMWRRVFFIMEQTSMPGFFLFVVEMTSMMIMVWTSIIAMMILILIVMITMKLDARTAWGDGVSHYAARHGTVCMLRFLLYTIKFTFSNYAVCIFVIYDINKLGRCETITATDPLTDRGSCY